MKAIDLNCDMGESFGNYKLGLDEEVIKYISSANVACGFHAGDPMVMEHTVKMAKMNHVAVGAHPGFPDMMGFGRRELAASNEEITNYIIYQVGALSAFAKANQTNLHHVKPHGKLYSMSWKSEEIAMATAMGIAKVDPALIYLVMAGPKGDFAVKAGERFGLKMAREAFPDRAYLPDGSLVPRGQKGDVIHDSEEVVARAVKMASENKITAIDGTTIEMRIDTICVHGDNPSAIGIVKDMKNAFASEEILIKSLKDIPNQK